MGNKELAQKIIEEIGGSDNITQNWHCITRLRFNVVNPKEVQLENLQNLEGVMGARFQGDQLQVIIGSEVANVFNEVKNLVGTNTNEAKPAHKENIINRILDVISGIFTPILPAIVGGGLLKGILAILGATHILAATSPTYEILSAFSDAMFYFFPFLIAMSAANKFKTSPSISLALAGVLMYPTFVNLAAAGEVTRLTFLGFLPVPVANYSSSVLPMILGIWVLSYVEKGLKKIVPKSLDIVFTPLLSLLATAPILLAVIAPLGSYIGRYLDLIFSTLFTVAGPLGGALMGGLMPVIVITGMHYAFFPGAFVSLQTLGYEKMLLPMNIVANLSQAGATLAVLLKTKDEKMKQVAFSAFIPAIFGITEPAIYGVTMKLKKPFYASLIGGAVGGAILGGFGVKAFSFTLPGVLALPTYIENGTNNFIYALVGVAASFVIGFVATLFLKFESSEVAQTTPKEAQSTVSKVSGPKYVASPMSGVAKSLSECPDETFSSELVGKGAGIIPEEGVVKAPFDGEITMTTPTNHAIGIRSNEGVEVLVHIGIDTVDMKGDGFTRLVEEGQKVYSGQALLNFDIKKIQASGHSLFSPVVVTNTTDYLDIMGYKENNSKVVANQDELLVVVD
ncbi:MAG: beta-glucoside-specific PTS transporter subunit IIABC [Streptococcaceae bacterium]|jgi:PTS system beta-glucosides-specific IIC component|nr:beta-glucoside-specific PTS transporter subunit IIABC [Streptococcaceae bacterium]